MEIAIVIFLGCWISAAGILSYRRLKREFEEADRDKNGDQD